MFDAILVVTENGLRGSATLRLGKKKLKVILMEFRGRTRATRALIAHSHDAVCYR